MALLTADMLFYAVLHSGLLRASYIDENGEQQPAGPLFIVQVGHATHALYLYILCEIQVKSFSSFLCPSSICSWPFPEWSSCWAFWFSSSSCWRVMLCSIASLLSSTRPPTSGTKVEVMCVSTVTPLHQQTTSVAQHQTTLRDTFTAEDFSETWGRFSSLHDLFRKKTIEREREKKKILSLVSCCIYRMYPLIYWPKDLLLTGQIKVIFMISVNKFFFL